MKLDRDFRVTVSSRELNQFSKLEELVTSNLSFLETFIRQLSTDRQVDDEREAALELE